MEQEKSTKKWRSILKKLFFGMGNVLWVLFIGLATLLLCSVRWMFKTWQNLNMEELVYQLKAPIQGTSTDMIWDYVENCVILTVIMMIACVAALILRRRIPRYRFMKLGMLFLAAAAITVSVVYTWEELDISAYTKNQTTYSTFIDDNYVNPRFAQMEFPEQKRNLIYIFLESMETTYADQAHGGAFSENAIPELTLLSNENESFSGNDTELNGGYPMTGTTWTAGAMFGQTSGLPLNLPIGNDDMYTQDSFLPEVVSLGDILEQAGYEQTLLIGSYALFSGRDKYFSQHGDYNIRDYAWSVNTGEIPEDYYVWWGYEDKKLFEHAKERLTELAAQEKPFNLTMLTADTHFEDGYFCEDCQEQFGEDQYSNVMACSSRKVYELVRWIQQQDFYENTTIVISGDHLTMDSDYCENVDEGYVRRVYTTYINAAAEPESDLRREYTTFDNFPTTLASLGVHIEGERLGLGTNLFSSEPTLAEKYGYEEMDREVAKKSMLMEEITQGIDTEKTKEIKQEEKRKQEEQKEAAQAQAEQQAAAQENLPLSIEVSPYDYQTGKFSVVIRNLPAGDIQAVQVPVWSEEDQSDLVWYSAARQEDGSYLAEIWASDFMFKQAEYVIHIYGVSSAGEMQLLGEGRGRIG